MRLLADENMDEAIVQWLRNVRLDVKWIAQTHPGVSDPWVLQLANDEDRILLTNDLDFGEHIVRHHAKAPGVILLRFTVESQNDRLSLLQSHWSAIESQAPGHLIAVTDRRIRVRPL
jgi:predicted nuclease of predicted toxin-antitoxin system